MEWKMHHILNKYCIDHVSECGCAWASVISLWKMWDQVRQTIIISCNKMFSYHLLLHSLTCRVFKVRDLRDLVRTLIKQHWWVILIHCSKQRVSGKILSDAKSCFVMSCLTVYAFFQGLHRDTKIHNTQKSIMFRCNTFKYVKITEAVENKCLKKDFWVLTGRALLS